MQGESSISVCQIKVICSLIRFVNKLYFVEIITLSLPKWIVICGLGEFCI
jgi:hypothetical protein